MAYANVQIAPNNRFGQHSRTVHGLGTESWSLIASSHWVQCTAVQCTQQQLGGACTLMCRKLVQRCVQSTTDSSVLYSEWCATNGPQCVFAYHTLSPHMFAYTVCWTECRSSEHHVRDGGRSQSA